jgi:hypothetical protein
MKHGQLGQIVSDKGISDTTTTTTTTGTTTPITSRNNRNNSNSNNNQNATTTSESTTNPSISSDLVKWMASKQKQQQSSSSSSFVEEPNLSDDDKTSLDPVLGKTENNHNNNKDKDKDDNETTKREFLVQKLEQFLEQQQKPSSKQSFQDILTIVQELLTMSSSLSWKQLFGGSSKRRYNYRLAWVGSDETITYIGTGLHRVPLARLQEVFFSALGNNNNSYRIELLEVIRLLGPFPNVKNVLQGTIQMSNNNNNKRNNNNNNNSNKHKMMTKQQQQHDTAEAAATTTTSPPLLQIVMDRMVDGTGKEISAGTMDNIRRVTLQVELMSEQVLIMVVPRSIGRNDGNSNSEVIQRRNDPMEDNGKHVLVFVKEDNLEGKLNSLRVS